MALRINFFDQPETSFVDYKSVRCKWKNLTKKFLNDKIAIQYKKMLIQNYLGSVITYGSEIYGMRETRLSQLKSVYDSAFKKVLKKKNFCRNRAYEEFDVKPLAMIAAIARARAQSKWSGSNGIIKSMIESANKIKFRRKTWTTLTRMWLKRHKIDMKQDEKEVKQQVRSQYDKKINKNDKSVIGKFSKKFKIKSGKLIRKLQVGSKANTVGAIALTKLRTGTLKFSREIMAKLKEPKIRREACICCNKAVNENTEHILLYCDRFKNTQI